MGIAGQSERRLSCYCRTQRAPQYSAAASEPPQQEEATFTQQEAALGSSLAAQQQHMELARVTNLNKQLREEKRGLLRQAGADTRSHHMTREGVRDVFGAALCTVDDGLWHLHASR